MRLYSLGTEALAGELGYTCSGEPTELDDYEIRDLEGKGLVKVWYWYTTGSYEGSGQLLALDSAGKYHVHDMGHCSCNGPTDGFSTSDPFDSLDDIARRCSPDLMKDLRVLIEAARSAVQ